MSRVSSECVPALPLACHSSTRAPVWRIAPATASYWSASFWGVAATIPSAPGVLTAHFSAANSHPPAPTWALAERAIMKTEVG